MLVPQPFSFNKLHGFCSDSEKLNINRVNGPLNLTIKTWSWIQKFTWFVIVGLNNGLWETVPRIVVLLNRHFRGKPNYTKALKLLIELLLRLTLVQRMDDGVMLSCMHRNFLCRCLILWSQSPVTKRYAPPPLDPLPNNRNLRVDNFQACDWSLGSDPTFSLVDSDDLYGPMLLTDGRILLCATCK